MTDRDKPGDPDLRGASYDIGYRRPPRHTQFKPGQSGNRRGRPRGTRKFSTLFGEKLRAKVRIRDGGRPMAVREILINNLVASALKGDPKARDQLIKLLGQAGELEPEVEAAISESLTADDQAIIADFLRRHQESTAAPPEEEPAVVFGKKESKDD